MFPEQVISRYYGADGNTDRATWILEGMGDDRGPSLVRKSGRWNFTTGSWVQIRLEATGGRRNIPDMVHGTGMGPLNCHCAKTAIDVSSGSLL